jgi:hypothetical protein
MLFYVLLNFPIALGPGTKPCELQTTSYLRCPGNVGLLLGCLFKIPENSNMLVHWDESKSLVKTQLRTLI